MSTFEQRRHQVLTPALEGSKVIQPQNSLIPFGGRPLSQSGRGMFGPYDRGYYPGGMLQPIRPPFMGTLPPDRIEIPTMVPRPRLPYVGPPSLMPHWGGYSVGPRYFPAPIPVPIIIRKPRPVELPYIPPKKVNLPNRPNSVFLFGIILKEIVAALHRIYLNPNGNIYPVLNDIIGPNCYDLAALVHGGQIDTKEESVLIQELQYVVENLVYHITEIMPSTGVLGTHRKSAVFELIRSGKRFPDGYFWQVEMDRLQFTENGRTHNVTDSESFLLMLGIFISRSLVTTILMKPIDYGLSSQALSDVAERNLRIVASTMLFLVRRMSIQRARGIMEMPVEIAKYLYSDEEMQHVYSKLSRTFNYCEGLLREWGTEYIRRLRAASMQKDQ